MTPLFRFNLRDFLPTIKALILLFLIGISWYLLRHTPAAKLLQDYEWIRLRISENGFYGPLIFIPGGALLTAIGFPRIAFSAISGFVFGFTVGSLFGLAGTITGCIITFYYAKLLGRGFIEKRIPQRLRKFEELLKEHSFSMTLMVRLFPIGNNMLTNLLAGVSSIKPVPYFLGSLIGYIPQTLIFALIGSGVRKEIWLRGSLSILLFALSLLIMFFLTKRILNQK